MDGSYVASVVISGLVIVFLALIILIAAVLLFGKIFESIGAAAKKKQVEQSAKAPAEIEKAAPEAAPAPPPVTAPVPAVEDGIPEEVVAVIAAAIAAMSAESGKKFAVRSISRSSSSRRGAWGSAALSESTRTF